MIAILIKEQTARTFGTSFGSGYNAALPGDNYKCWTSNESDVLAYNTVLIWIKNVYVVLTARSALQSSS
jgi:hypothetical protein